ncbi:MAG: PadR family transcriptional regulator [Candidatus Omnitrophota bacterium]
MDSISREILLSFWKIHILHHAGEEAVYGQWIMQELRRHGYEISPGTLYPLLRRMERCGWLKSVSKAEGYPRERRNYRLTNKGRQALDRFRDQVKELYKEVVEKNNK